MYKILVDGDVFCSSKLDDLAVINPVITNEVNKAGTFTFMIPPTHPYYDLIQKRISIIEVYRDDNAEPVFAGIASEVTDDFYRQRKITCEGEFSFFNDSVLRPHHYQGVTPRQLLEAYINAHNSQVEETKRFTVGQVTVTDPNNYITCYTNYDSTMESLKEDLVDDLGGYFRIRHENGSRILDYLASSPRTNEQIIKLGENLIDFKSTLDTTKIATVIIPLGATLSEENRTSDAVAGLDERVTIKSVNGGLDYLQSEEAVESYGWIEQVVTWSDVNTPSILKTKAQKYLQDTQFENLVIEAKAVDLNIADNDIMQFKLLDNIHVISKPHGLDRNMMLTKQTINLNNPENDTITLGIDEIVSMSTNAKKINQEVLKKIENIPSGSSVQSAIDNATALLKGAEGGHIKIVTDTSGKPEEILIMDTADISTATKIWRWNQNGLGYSDDGGSTYGIAITQDGGIVADFITAGTFSGDLIRGGTLEVGGRDNVSGQFRVLDEDSVEVARMDKDGLSMQTAGYTERSYSNTITPETYSVTYSSGTITIKPVKNFNALTNPAYMAFKADRIKFYFENQFTGTISLKLKNLDPLTANVTPNMFEGNTCELSVYSDFGFTTTSYLGEQRDIESITASTCGIKKVEVYTLEGTTASSVTKKMKSRCENKPLSNAIGNKVNINAGYATFGVCEINDGYYYENKKLGDTIILGILTSEGINTTLSTASEITIPDYISAIDIYCADTSLSKLKQMGTISRFMFNMASNVVFYEPYYSTDSNHGASIVTNYSVGSNGEYVLKVYRDTTYGGSAIKVYMFVGRV